MERPTLTLDLSGPDGNVFMVIGRARLLLTGQLLEHFNLDVRAALVPDAGKTYQDILAIVNSYVRLIDTSGLYAEYAVNQEEVIAAITRFNEQLKSLPDDVPCSLEDLYPDFNDPDCDAYAYLALLMMDIASVEKEIADASEAQVGPLQRLLTMLQECASALERAGIG
jgi:hypothetical protein